MANESQSPLGEAAILDSSDVVRHLEGLGLVPLEARAYVALLGGPMTVDELAAEIQAEASRTSPTLVSLLKQGLATRLPGEDPRFALSPPDSALAALLHRKEEEVASYRILVHDLAHRHQQTSPREEYVNVVVGVDAVLAQIDEIEASAREEIVAFFKAPVLSLDNPGAEDSLKQGIPNRWLWERDTLEAQPGLLDVARRWSAIGEEIRVAGSLPSKLVIVDRRTAAIKVTEDSAEGPQTVGLLTRHPELVASLYRLFELLWAQGVPLPAMNSQASQVSEEVGDGDLIVACLRAGLTDGAIARELGISRRTLARRLQELKNDLGVDTRFQAGYKIGREDE